MCLRSRTPNSYMPTSDQIHHLPSLCNKTNIFLLCCCQRQNRNGLVRAKTLILEGNPALVISPEQHPPCTAKEEAALPLPVCWEYARAWSCKGFTHGQRHLWKIWDGFFPLLFACSKNSIISFAQRMKLLCTSQCKMIASKYLSTLQMLNLLRRPKEIKYLKVPLLARFFFHIKLGQFH